MIKVLIKTGPAKPLSPAMTPDKCSLASVELISSYQNWPLASDSDSLQLLDIVTDLLQNQKKIGRRHHFLPYFYLWGLFFLPSIAVICFPPPDLWVSSVGSPVGKKLVLTRCCQRDAHWKHTRGTCESANSSKWPLICRNKDRHLLF